ncbi:MAG: hypothetical protein IQL11_03100 [Bacteroidales bacterium]|nr:hypothetical protein [Bacteroidales bacterium]
MKISILSGIVIAGIGLISSCSNPGDKTSAGNTRIADKILQQADDGTISLKLEKADCYADMSQPTNNTAEWNVMVSKTGRFNVWLSSATMDTTKLHYRDQVQVTVHDIRLAANPGLDRIIPNSGDVRYPYFKADSYLGSMFIQDTGLYSIQVISDMIIPKEYEGKGPSGADITRLLSVSFTPTTR